MARQWNRICLKLTQKILSYLTTNGRRKFKRIHGAMTQV